MQALFARLTPRLKAGACARFWSDRRKSYGEPRHIGMGFIQGRVMVMVYTEREGNVIRIISLRKANKREQNKFKKAIQDRLGTR